MTTLQTLIDWLAPYQFSWLAVTVYPGGALAYYLGIRAVRTAGGQTGFWRPFAFFTGVSLCYIVMHTKFDYYGQFLFFMHRAQHLVLHHVGAMMIALGNPATYWRAAIPQRISARADTWLSTPQGGISMPGRALLFPVRMLQHPLIGSLIFVGLIYFWLTPAVHFDAMLSHNLYLLMNWSMIIDGVLFWMVIVDPRPVAAFHTTSYATRFVMIVGTTIPQILLGAFITLSSQNLYKVYAVCGRAWPIAPLTDQLYGGLLTWIPPAMMELAGALIVLSLLMEREYRTMNTSLATQPDLAEKST